MSTMIHISSAIRAECGCPSELTVSAATVAAALRQLEQSHPALYQCVCDETGTPRRHINFFVNSTLIRDLAGLDTTLESADILTIMTAVSGG